MSRTKLTGNGAKKLQILHQELKRAGQRYEEAFARAIYQRGLKVDELAVRKTPVDTGRLRATHYVAPPVLRGEDYVVEVGFGTDYAVYVHERTDQAHKTGESKFLEKALNEVAHDFAEKVAVSTENNVRRGLGLRALPGDVPEKPRDPGQAKSGHRWQRTAQGFEQVRKPKRKSRRKSKRRRRK